MIYLNYLAEENENKFVEVLQLNTGMDFDTFNVYNLKN